MTQYQRIGEVIGNPHGRRVAPFKAVKGFTKVYDDFGQLRAVKIRLECNHTKLWRGEPPKTIAGKYKRTPRTCLDCSFCRRCWQPWTAEHKQVKCKPPKNPNAVQMPW